MIKLLLRLNEEIDRQVCYICNVLQSECNEKSVVFDEYICFKNKPNKYPRSKALWGRHGIYVFVMNNDKSVTEEQIRKWNNLNQGASFKNYTKYELKRGDCIYLGDCVSCSLFSRINQHFASNESYTSLKLNNPARSFLKDDLIIYAFPINKQYTEQDYRIILPVIERRLHDKLNPKCGSKRT